MIPRNPQGSTKRKRPKRGRKRQPALTPEAQAWNEARARKSREPGPGGISRRSADEGQEMAWAAAAADTQRNRRALEYEAGQQGIADPRVQRQYGPSTIGVTPDQARMQEPRDAEALAAFAARARAEAAAKRRRGGADLTTPRSPESIAYEKRAAVRTRGLVPDVLQGAQGVLKLAEGVADVATGIPSLIRDPSWGNAGWAAASLFPVGKVLKFGKAGVTGVRSMRKVGKGAVIIEIAATDSALMRPLEQLGSTISAHVAPGLSERTVGREFKRTATNLEAARRGTGEAARKIRTNPKEQQAILAIGRGVTPQEKIKGHLDDIADITRMRDEDEITDAVMNERIRGHQQQIAALAKIPDEWWYRQPDGKLAFSKNAPANVRQMFALMSTSETESRKVLEGLEILGPDTAAKLEARLHKPGRVTLGARHISKEDAERAADALSPEIVREDDLANLVEKEARGLVRKGTPELRSVGNEYSRAHRDAMRSSAKARQLAAAVEQGRDIQDEMYELAGRVQGMIGKPITDPVELKVLEGMRERLRSLSRQLTGKIKATQRYHAALAREADAIGRRAESGAALVEERASVARRAWQLREMAEESRRVVDELSITQEQIASRFGIVGQEGFKGGQLFIPDRPGIPGRSWRTPSIGVRVMFSGGPRRVLRLAAEDKSITKEWTGFLQRSGMVDTNVGELTADHARKIARLQMLRDTRGFLKGMGERIKESYSTPDEWLAAIRQDRENFVPIRIDPDGPGVDKWTWEKWETAALDDEMITALSKEFFPKAKELAKDIGIKGSRQTVLDEIAGSWFPDAEAVWATIDATKDFSNIVFVPRNTVTSAMESFMRTQLKGKLGAGIATLADLQRFATLFTNPIGYTTANVLGNVGSGILQQGAFLPANVIKAFRASKRLPPDVLASIDLGVGTGAVKSVLAPSTGIAKRATHPFTDFIHMITDLPARRSSFFHEARKLGMTDDDIVRTVRGVRHDDAQAIADWDRILRKANDAMGDYTRMGPLERDVLSKVFFLYPFLKASTRYTLRFPLEHPFESVGLGIAGKEYHEASQSMGDKPAFMDYYIRASKEWFPWLEDYGVINLSGLSYFGIPIEIMRNIYGTATGKKEYGNLFSTIGPMYASVIGAIQGVDPERGYPVEGNFLEKFAQLEGKTVRGYALGKEFAESDVEQSGDLFPYDTGDLVAKTIGGSLSPVPYNAKVGEGIARSENPPSAVQRVKADIEERHQAIVEGFTAAAKQPPPPEVVDALEMIQEYEVAEAQLKAQLANNKEFKDYREIMKSRGEKPRSRTGSDMQLTTKQELVLLLAVIESSPRMSPAQKQWAAERKTMIQNATGEQIEAETVYTKEGSYDLFEQYQRTLKWWGLRDWASRFVADYARAQAAQEAQGG